MSHPAESENGSRTPGPIGERVIVLAPQPRDATVLQRTLCHEFNCVICNNMSQLTAAADEGAAALIIACETAEPEDLALLSAMLKRQPAWSHLAVIVLTHSQFSEQDIDAVIKSLDATSPTMLERPVQTTTLRTTLLAALHARRRQYEIRDQLDEREKHNTALLEHAASLEKRLRERTVRLESLTQRLRLLAAKLTDVEQRERRRLAQLIHDHLQQSLVGAKIRVSIAANTAPPAMKAQLQGAVEMIDDSLGAARSLTSELRPPVLYEVGLNAALRWLAGRFLDQHGLQVRLTLDEETPPLPERRRALLFDAIRELLLNTVAHAGVNEAAVTVRREKAEMHVTVEDRGQGFDVAVIDPSTSPDASFGLFGVRERIRALGGQFTIVSSLGNGTCVDLFLPVDSITPATSEVDRPTSEQFARPRIESPPGGERTVRVLLADDHPIVREGIAGILKAQPTIDVVAQACDGEEAVNMARRLHPDVIVMDVNMPRMNGIEATRRIHDEQPDTPIIGLSVQDESGTADAMLSAGAAAYLFKGGDPDELVRCILSASGTDRGATSASSP